MKDCNNCRYMFDAGGESPCYVCDLFGEDVPSEFAKGDGCCLHINELKKALRLRDQALIWSYIIYDQKPTELEERYARETSAEFNKYMKHLKKKYERDGK